MKDHSELEPSLAAKVMHICASLEHFKVDIERALEYSYDGLTYDKVVARILSGQYHYYPLERSVIIMEPTELESTKVYFGVIAAGDLEEIASQHEHIEAVAHELGCTDLMLSGRRGWTKAFKKHGWSEVHTVLRKPIATQLGKQE